jgi:L-ascorbate metabolism protein UlaG (beta-lactamase superfamily)
VRTNTNVEVTWLGHASFRIRGKEGVVVTDPASRSTGYQIGKPTADVVTISSDDPGHSAFELVGGEPRRLDAPGEYEMSGIPVVGVRMKKASGDSTTAFVFELDEVRVCHLGTADRLPTAAEIEAINEPDVLLIPVGGGGAYDGKQAAEVASLLNAKYVIPMRYKTDAAGDGLEGIEGFLKETGQAAAAEPQPKLTVSKSQVPEDLRVVVLDARKI